MCSENFKADFRIMASATPALIKNTSHPFLLKWKRNLSITIIDRFYIALFSALEQTHCARMWFYLSEQLFIEHFWISTGVVYLQRWPGWCHMKLLPARRVLCTPYSHAPCHFVQSHIRELYAYLAVTCHPHFWQNDQGLLRATAVNIKIMSRTCRFETCRYL